MQLKNGTVNPERVQTLADVVHRESRGRLYAS